MEFKIYNQEKKLCRRKTCQSKQLIASDNKLFSGVDPKFYCSNLDLHIKGRPLEQLCL